MANCWVEPPSLWEWLTSLTQSVCMSCKSPAQSPSSDMKHSPLKHITNSCCNHLSHWDCIQENSAKLTNQRISYVFTSSPLSFHARHILPTSKFQHSYSCILLIFYNTDISEQHVWELWVRIYSTGLTLPLRVIPMNNPITHHQYSRWA